MKKLNLQLLKKSRLKQGDVFAVLIGGTYLFGRVVNDKIPMMGSYVALIYIYNVKEKEPKTDTDALTPDKLLLPPIITFRNAWSQGHALKITSLPLRNEDLLPRHCFQTNEGKYVDELGNDIGRQKDDCGKWAITSLGIIDDLISDALNIKRAPLQEDDIWYISGRGEKIWLKQPLSELKKYANYEDVVDRYPEVIES